MEGIASFSSQGPTYDGRTKPDVVAPGYFAISAEASLTDSLTDETCAVTAMAGTSMASHIISQHSIVYRNAACTMCHAVLRVVSSKVLYDDAVVPVYLLWSMPLATCTPYHNYVSHHLQRMSSWLHAARN
jgi:Subtilase family